MEFEHSTVLLIKLHSLKYDLEDALSLPVDVIHAPLPVGSYDTAGKGGSSSMNGRDLRICEKILDEIGIIGDLLKGIPSEKFLCDERTLMRFV